MEALMISSAKLMVEAELIIRSGELSLRRENIHIAPTNQGHLNWGR